jgi:tight adherence protein C
MTILLPTLAFLAVFAVVILMSRRSQRTALHLDRHMLVAVGAAPVVASSAPRQILGVGPRPGTAGQLATRMTRQKVRTKSGKLLREAGNPMSLPTYLLTRLICTFVVMPLFVLYLWFALGLSLIGVVTILVGGFTIPQLPLLRIKRRARKRAHAIETAMPDALDLLVVCVEAGLGLNQALVRVSEEIERLSPVLSEQLALVNLEIRAGTPRDEAFRNMGDRTGLDDIRSLMAMLIQTDRFGTSVATALRVHADTMRTKRRQRAEEAAAKTTIKLVFPLVLFIFPAMFVVILGSAIIQIYEALGQTS